MKRLLCITAVLCSVLPWLFAETGNEAAPSPQIVSEDQSVQPYQNLKGISGHVNLPDGKAELDLVDGYVYLDPEQTRYLLEDLWGNPDGSGSLGAILPPNFGLQGETSWAIILTYEDTGHVDDKDAREINYDDLLSQLRKDVEVANVQRKLKKYSTVELKGWAATPHYDGSTKKLFWAKELQFSDSSTPTLNYEIRILGRSGVLDMNVVAGISDLKAVENATPKILSQANFAAGQRYTDFNPASDHLAEFGVAGLILGGVAVKAGLLKMILAGLAASWKFILVGVAAIGVFLAKRFGGRKKQAPADAAIQTAPEKPDDEKLN